MVKLILGGARSGKSHYAEQYACSQKKEIILIATAQAHDKEMERRIRLHQKNRHPSIKVVEEPFFLADSLHQWSGQGRTLIVDCLTLWLTNLLCSEKKELLKQEQEALLNIIVDLSGDLLLVSNETGLGVVPMDQLTRTFVDEAGRLHQALAKVSHRVVMMVAGLPMILKGK